MGRIRRLESSTQEGLIYIHPHRGILGFMKIVGSGAKYTECIRGQLVLSNAEGVPFRYCIDFNLLFFSVFVLNV